MPEDHRNAFANTKYPNTTPTTEKYWTTFEKKTKNKL